MVTVAANNISYKLFKREIPNSTMLGAFRDNSDTRREFLNIIGNPASREDR